ncbi:NUDIX domain-containing protein [Chloroflexota bacterium]
MKEHRISAGAIIIQEDKILLVRYSYGGVKGYLVGPGGGVEDDEESLTQTLQREVREETGLDVVPAKLLFVEDFLSSRNKHVKIWFLCNIIGGKVEKTQGAVEEKITEVRWYSRDELDDELVYPAVLLEESWDSFYSASFEARYLGFGIADF